MSLKDLTYFVYKTQFGEITIASNGKSITALSLERCKMSGRLEPTNLTNRCSTEILEYFAGKRKLFDLPTEQDGTPFQKRVWNALAKIDYAERITPSALAEIIGQPRSYRKISSAAHQNKIAILIPNHRLVPHSNFEKPSPQEKMRVALRKLEENFAKNRNI